MFAVNILLVILLVHILLVLAILVLLEMELYVKIMTNVPMVPAEI
uniref:Uncharacterized protein n=1 Tax=Arcella intermedia TaxID=1963864 RepID=A0A6B2LW26_9EUKA